MRVRNRMIAAARAALATVLALLLATGGPLQSAALAQAAEGAAGNYLAEVYVGVGKTVDEATRDVESKGYSVLKADGKAADLNQGAGSALKENRAVVLGYKTTADPEEAITDLAVMNMNGGYSFSSYAQLMDKYRDSQVRPFIERFMVAVGEYRANAASDSRGNKARAEFARTMLNRIVDDDTGGRLGDLLLEKTRAEVGDAYDGMSAEEKTKHIDLERALMQGNSEVVYLAEQLLSFAADDQPTTWLERLSELGPDGLVTQDDRPADVESQLASRYQDLAVKLSEGWEDMRAQLVAYAEAQGDASDAQGPGDSGGDDAQPQDATVPITVVEGEDEADVSNLVHIETPVQAQESGEEMSPADAPQVLAEVNKAMGDMADAADDIADTRTASLYTFLKSKPYGDGSLYDLFARPASEVTGNGISALYPAASCLSEGQAAVLEFLPLPMLLQVGATTGDALADVWVEGLGLIETAEGIADVSLYQGVNREIFSDVTALTSDAMREDALRRQSTGVVDFLSTYKRSALLWGSSALAAVLVGVSAYKASRNAALAQTVARARETLSDMNPSIINMREHVGFQVERVAKSGPSAMKVTVIREVQANVQAQKEALLLQARSGKMDLGTLTSRMQELNNQTTTETVTQYFSADSGLSEGLDDFDKALDQMGQKQSGFEKAAAGWGYAKYAMSFVFLGLTVASIASTVMDLISYYNVDFAPVPGYIVDISDITRTEPDGTQTVVRNDKAYYSVAKCSASREGDRYKAMLNYADLNGDAGKEWLALYSASRSGQGPVLADSLRAVVGTASVPDGYEGGVHAFGSNAAANLTDARYCYNDDAGGVYLYFKREVAAAPGAASVFSSGGAALAGGAGLVAGAAIGAGVTAYVGRRRRAEAA